MAPRLLYRVSSLISGSSSSSAITIASENLAAASLYFEPWGLESGRWLVDSRRAFLALTSNVAGFLRFTCFVLDDRHDGDPRNQQWRFD